VQLSGGTRQDVLSSVSGQSGAAEFSGPIELNALGVLLLWSFVGAVVVVVFNALRTARARQRLLEDHGLDVKASPSLLAPPAEPAEN
ncbi:MAG: hypothetical protein WCI74_15195, partial [Actinomycetes bacterium]